MEGNRWLATWAFWMLGRRDMAVRALISPLDDLIEYAPPPSHNLHAKSFLASDPALVVLYKHLRDRSLQTLRGASSISPRAEWEFVMQHARLYSRMGCDLLALDLVRNWVFMEQRPDRDGDAAAINGNGIVQAHDARKLLRSRRSSLVVDVDDDLAPMKTAGGPKSPPTAQGQQRKGKEGKSAPTMFEEPAASSLLDSFGF